MTALLEVSDVSVALGGRPVLDGVNLAIDEGQFAGLIGSNGAGKTTLLRVILGLLHPDSGSVLVAGRPLERTNPLIGYVPQKIGLDPDIPLRARDLVGLGVDGHRAGIRSTRDKRERVEEALHAVGADGFADRRVGRLSGGEQQRVMIAHALAARPRLLLLDEPLANLDISSSDGIVEVLDRVSRDQGVAVVISAHDMNPLLPSMDRIIYMAGGRATTGSVEEVVRTEVLSDLYRHPVEVLRVQGRVLVVGGESEGHCE